MVDDELGTLGPVALTLTRLGVLTLYTPFADEASLLAAQEPGLIRAIVVTPNTPMGPLANTIRSIEPHLGGNRASLVVVSDGEPDDACRARTRELGASWAISLPISDNDLRFVLSSATTLPAELARRAHARAPVELGASLYWQDRETSGVIVSLSPGGVFVELEDQLDVGTHIRLGFELGGELIEAKGRVVHANLRGTSMSPALPQGIGVEFDGLDADSKSAIQELVKARILHFAP
jgi:Tfp pilus assembly protein PilZ